MRKKILLAEDDPDISYILKTMLRNVGFEVKAIQSGKSLMSPNSEHPDLYILDKQMPDVDGIEVCKHLKADSSTKDIPVIMVSACPDLSFFAKDGGAEGFLEKPFKMRDLLSLINKYI